MPYIVLSQVSGEPTTTSFAGTNALQTVRRWRFSCYGTTYKGAKTLAKYVKLAMLSLAGTQTGSVFIEGSWLKMEADDAEPIQRRDALLESTADFEITLQDRDVS